MDGDQALVADRRRALVVQRTGWGKSAVYFVATALLRDRGAGPTVIISPLLALMRNQIAAAARAGIRAGTINSANAEEWDDVHAEVAAGAVDVLLVTPERLNNPGFRDEVLPQLADGRACWSSTRRTASPTGATTSGRTTGGSGRCSGACRRASRCWPPPRPPTRGWRRRRRAARHRRRGPRAGAARHRWTGTPCTWRSSGCPTTAQRLAWLPEHLQRTARVRHRLLPDRRRGRAGRGPPARAGLRVAAYSGRTEPARTAGAEEDLLANRVKALVATSALGMGFDKPDLGFVVHLGAPPSPIAYYQQVGRAGPRVGPGRRVLLPGPEDPDIWELLRLAGFPAGRRSGRPWTSWPRRAGRCRRPPWRPG